MSRLKRGGYGHDIKGYRRFAIQEVRPKSYRLITMRISVLGFRTQISANKLLIWLLQLSPHGYDKNNFE